MIRSENHIAIYVETHNLLVGHMKSMRLFGEWSCDYLWGDVTSGRF